MLLEMADITVTGASAAERTPERLLLAPTRMVPKSKVAAPSLNWPAGVLLPNRGIFSIESAAFETTVRLPALLPGDFGRKTALKV